VQVFLKVLIFKVRFPKEEKEKNEAGKKRCWPGSQFSCGGSSLQQLGEMQQWLPISLYLHYQKQ